MVTFDNDGNVIVPRTSSFEERFEAARRRIEKAHREMQIRHAQFDVEYEKTCADIEAAHKAMGW